MSFKPNGRLSPSPSRLLGAGPPSAETSTQNHRTSSPGLFKPDLSGASIGADGQEEDHDARNKKKAAPGEGQKIHTASDKPRSWGSGGFLLRNSLHNSRGKDKDKPSSARTTNSSDTSPALQNGNIKLPKRGSARSGPSEAMVKESSKRYSQESNSRFSDTYRSSRISSTGESSRSAASPSPNPSQLGSDASTTHEKASVRMSTPAFDIDSAQIVNLALNLGEARRRNVSSGTYLSPSNPNARERASSGSPSQATSNSPYSLGSSPRKHLQQARAFSNSSPGSGASQNGRDRRSGTANMQRRRSHAVPGFQADVQDSEVDMPFKASEATLSRAEKARITLEMGYEFRRLLQYLPAFPKATNTKSGKRRFNDGMRSAQDGLHLGREYNPLQYARNRRVRLREKKPLNPELEGWRDLDRARAWIDAVKNDRQAGISRIDDKFPLPSYEAAETMTSAPEVVDSSPVDDVRRDKHGNYLRRPNMDWVFAPWEMLADVHWQHQDHNFERLEDAAGRRIFPSVENHKVHLPKRSRGESDASASRPSTSLSKQTFHHEHVGSLSIAALHNKVQAHQPFKQQEPRSSLDSDRSPRIHRSRWAKNLLRSRSQSSSNDTDWSGHSHNFSNPERSEKVILEKQMMQLLAAEAEHENPQPQTRASPKQPTGVHNMHGRDLPQKANRLLARPKTLQRNHTDTPTRNDPNGIAASSPVEERRSIHRRMSSDDLLSSPGSPLDPRAVPSIAVNSSTSSPPDQSKSPLKRPLAARLGSFRRDRSKSTTRRAVLSEQDRPKDSSLSTRTVEPGKSKLSSFQASEGQALVSPGRLAVKSRSGTLDSLEQSTSNSKFRGVFKSGRLAEIVSGEASRVGDRLWRKESSSNLAHMSPISPFNTSTTTDSHADTDLELNKIERTQSNATSETDSPNEETDTPKTPSQRSRNRPRYHMHNLPSFQSPFAKSGNFTSDVQISADGDRIPRQHRAQQQRGRSQSRSLDDQVPPVEEDHITRQQRAQQQRGRSRNFDRLAPPRIDMRSISRSSSLASFSPSRHISRDESRGSSNNRSLRDVEKADRRLNDVLGIPGRSGYGRERTAPTGLSALSSTAQNAKDKSGKAIADHFVSNGDGPVSKRDIARVRAFLLSSGVKAQEVLRRYEEPPAKPSEFLASHRDIIKGRIPPVPVSQESVFIARALMNDIETTHGVLRENAERFSNETVDGLHKRTGNLSDNVNSHLTTMVRAAADEADVFGAKLRTTHLLATKELNDSIDAILRKRRRRARWLSTGGWAALEWLLLGMMWIAWLIAVIVRSFHRALHAFWDITKWLLWL